MKCTGPMSNVDQWSRFAEKLLRHGYDLAGASAAAILENDKEHGDSRLMAVLLVARSLSNMQGACTMIRESRVVEARVLARCILENGFWLVGFSEDPEKFRQAMVDQDQNRKGAAAQTLFETGEMTDAVEQKLRNWLRENSEWKTSKSVAPKQTARDAQLYAAYPFYELLSIDAHPTTNSLNRYIIAYDKMEITEVVLEPTPTQPDLNETITLACYGLVIVLQSACKVLQATAAEAVDSLAREYLQMMKADNQP